MVRPASAASQLQHLESHSGVLHLEQATTTQRNDGETNK